jgi:hypothetical protein
MRFYNFVALLFIALTLDLGLLALSLAAPKAHLFVPPAALAARPEAIAHATAASSPHINLKPSPTPTATSAPSPTPTAANAPSPTPTATNAPSPTPTATAMPQPQLLASKSVSFTPTDRAVRANIRLALAHYEGALTHIVLAPGNIFSFNATLGARPQRLPWKYVTVKPTAAPADATPQPPPSDPELQRVQGGGLCDLASRFVMAARPLLAPRAFKYVNHVKSNGIHLTGVPARDSVAIWAIGGGPGEQDLKITNLTSGWLEFIVERDGEKITVTAQLWDQPPLGW